MRNVFECLATMSLRYLLSSTFVLASSRKLSSSFPLYKAQDSPIKITDKCVNRLKEISNGGTYFLRITIDGGGCSGFQYRFDLDSQLHDDDESFEKNGIKIVVDKMSIPFIEGSTVDYHEELIRSAFRIIDNPQADAKCSCGASFAVKMT